MGEIINFSGKRKNMSNMDTGANLRLGIQQIDIIDGKPVVDYIFRGNPDWVREQLDEIYRAGGIPCRNYHKDSLRILDLEEGV